MQKDNNGKVVNQNTTSFFRKDLDWKRFARLLDNFYPKNSRVNIYDFGCSDGSEVWSFAIAILENTTKHSSERFMPIHAYDIDDNIIKTAKMGPCNITDMDLREINDMIVSDNYLKYFQPARSTNSSYPMALVPRRKLKDCVIFNQGNIFDKISELPKKNNVVLCRNFWKYLSPSERINLAKMLSEKLDNSSFVVIGALDRGFNVDELLEKNGFEEITYNVYKKLQFN